MASQPGLEGPWPTGERWRVLFVFCMGHWAIGFRVFGDSSAQGRSLGRQLRLNLQAPPPAALPKPDHRPNCRCPVNNSRGGVVQKLQKERRAAPGGMGVKEQRMHLSVTLFLLYNSNMQHRENGLFALFLFPFTTFLSHFL